jgi:aryl carrier-like protein
MNWQPPCGKGVSNSFHFQVLTFLQTTQELTSQEHTYKPSRPCAIILFHVLSIIFKDWVKDAMTELSFQKRETIRTSNSHHSTIDSTAQDRLVVDCFLPLHPPINRQDENIEVTDFFGWAIHSLRRVLSREYERIQELKWNTSCTLEEEEQMIRFLDSMRIFHTQAILDEEYLRDFYPPCHQLTNKGWLSLVTKPFFPFARYLLKEIRLIVDVDQWRRRGNGVIETAAKTLEENETLTVLFLDAAKTSSLDEKWKRKIMSELVFKVLHARSAAEHNKYKEQHTNREAKGAITSSFRGELKVLTKGSHNNKVKRRKMK